MTPVDAYGYPLAKDKNGQRLRPHSLVRYASRLNPASRRVTRRRDEWEYGVVTSINESYVFVHFFGDKQSKACKATDLEKG
jgi:hypothetical protein